jgi:signal transduction histidine kinase
MLRRGEDVMEARTTTQPKPEAATALESDLYAATLMRSLAEIAPAVAHDLRAPINAMVLNLEVLKETLAAGGRPPSPNGLPAFGGGRDPRERQQRYVNVLREELSRLHLSLELFLGHISPRANRLEGLDLREPAQDLAALLRPSARKQQSQIEVLVPDAPVPILATRYQLRQALLHVGLSALLAVPRDGRLEIRLDRHASRARLRILAAGPPGGGAGQGGGAAEAAGGGTAGPAAPPQPEARHSAAGAEARRSAAGAEARLEVARGIVAAQGGSVRLLPQGARGLPAFEIDWPLSETN